MKKILNVIWRVIRFSLATALVIITVLFIVALSITVAIATGVERIFGGYRILTMKILAVFKGEFSKRNTPRKGKVVGLSGTVKVKSHLRHKK